MAEPFRIALDRGFLNERGELAWGDIGIGALERAENIQLEFLADRVAELSPAIIARYQGLILGGVRVTGGTFASAAENLIVISRAGVGYDLIDVDACTANDVALCTTPSASKHAVASASFAYVLMLAKRLPDKDRLVRAGNWADRGAYCGNEIYGKTLGIVGFGNTGRELARLVAPFEMKVLTCDPYVAEAEARQQNVTLTTLEWVLREADFVCIHAKLTAETRHLIGVRELALMKPSAYFINCARGPIVDQDALTNALREGRIAGAGLDVFEFEPLPLDDPLLQLDNVMLSPHTAAHTLELSIAMGEVNSEQMLAAARGQPPRDVVNRAVLDRPGFRAKLDRWRAG